VCYEEQFGGICDEGLTFGDTEAKVACYQLGLSGENATGYKCPITTANKMWYNNITCSLSEEMLVECRKERMTGDCSDFYHVCLHCPVKSEVRLLGIDGQPHASGRLQIYFKGTWSEVCTVKNQWSNASSDVVCGELGLGKSTEHEVVKEQFQPGHTYLAAKEGINCLGNESNMKDCKVGPWIPAHEGSPQDHGVEITCSGPEIQSLLATSSDPYSIKVEWSVDQRVLLYTAVTGYLVNVTSSDTILDVRIITSQASTVHYSHAVSSLQPSTEYSITTCAVLESGDHGPTNSTTVRTGSAESVGNVGLVVGIPVGVGVLLVIIVVVGVASTRCHKCRRKR
jgi:hypothetical protein